MKGLEEEAQKKNREKKTNGKVKIEYTAIKVFSNWKFSGRQMNAKDKTRPLLGKNDAVALVKGLMPRLAPNEKWGDYNGMKKAIDWLLSLGGDTTWENEMEKLSKSTAERDGLGDLDLTRRLF